MKYLPNKAPSTRQAQPNPRPKRPQGRTIIPRQQGFTLIELMISVAIIGILAALSTQAFEGAVKRAHIADALSLVAPMKTIIAENFAFDASGNACSGISDITSPVGAVVSSSCSDDGTVTTVHVVMSEETGDIVADFVSDRGTGQVWVCHADTSVADHIYLPATCRH